MKKVKHILITLVLGSFILASCHKYPEDPFISFRQPGKRIVGTWNITKYQVWGIDHSHDFDSLLRPNTLTDCYINFFPYSTGDSYNEGNGVYTFLDKNKNPIFALKNDGSYYFEDSYKSRLSTLVFSFSVTIGSDTTLNKLFFNVGKSSTFPYESKWRIVELYGKQLHISTNGTDIYFKK